MGGFTKRAVWIKNLIMNDNLENILKGVILFIVIIALLVFLSQCQRNNETHWEAEHPNIERHELDHSNDNRVDHDHDAYWNDHAEHEEGDEVGFDPINVEDHNIKQYHDPNDESHNIEHYQYYEGHFDSLLNYIPNFKLEYPKDTIFILHERLGAYYA